MFSIESQEIITLNVVCLVCSALYFGVEIIQMKDMGWSYFLDFWNINDFSKFFMYVMYFYLRYSYPYNQILDTTGKDNRENEHLHLDSGYT